MELWRVWSIFIIGREDRGDREVLLVLSLAADSQLCQ